MRIATNKLLIPLLAAALLHVGAAAGSSTQEGTDPYVLLDAAKLKLAEGRLARAREMLAEIPLGAAEDCVSEEIVFQQLLVNSAYLIATHYLFTELQHGGHGDSAYAGWLESERDGYAASFAKLGRQFLDSTAAEPRLDFVRFRLPVVTAEHLNDLELYSDPEILSPAVTNWDDGREGLGKGLIAGQARVALVLAAARYYDLPEAAPSLEQVRLRLTSGVPLDYAEVLAWIAEEAARVADNPDLAAVRAAAQERLAQNAKPPSAERTGAERNNSAQNSVDAETSE